MFDLLSGETLKIKLGLKTEATWKTGFGHLKRLQNLVEGWANVEPLFISVNKLPDIDYSNLQIESAGDFHEAICDLDLLIVDEPQLQSRFLEAIPENFKVVGFDELGELRNRLNIHFVTTLLGLDNQVIQRGITKEYIGPDYFIFPELETSADIKFDRKILVTFGGSDPAGLSLNFVENMSSEILRHSVMVLGPAFKSSIRKSLQEFRELCFLDAPSSLVPYYKAYPLTITGGGVSAYEAIRFGSKALLCSQHAEQYATAQRLVKKGVACEFGVHPDVNWSELKLLLTKYIQEDSEIVLPSGQSLFDGQGVFRVRKILEEYAQS